MLYIDIDNVVRDMIGVMFVEEPAEWDAKTKWGINAYEALSKEPSLGLKAKQTELMTVANVCMDAIHFLSAQPKECRDFTDAWLHKHVIPRYYVYYVDHAIEKMRFVRDDDDLLIDDYPKFPDYSRVAVVHRKYNENVDAKIRIKTPDDFLKIITQYQ